MHYPGAVLDSDTGALISDAEVAETGYTLSIRGHGRVTARLVVRRVKDARYPDALFPVWRYHPFFTNSDLPTAEADLTHRQPRHRRDHLRRPDRRPARAHPVGYLEPIDRLSTTCMRCVGNPGFRVVDRDYLPLSITEAG